MERHECDVFIIGAGPAGASAAIYSARAGFETIVNEKGIVGGQAAQSTEIENYPGFELITGNDFGEKLYSQMKSSGAVISEFDPVKGLQLSEKEKLIETSTFLYSAAAVIIAAGAEPRRLPIKEEKRYCGKGIHYCALCDGSAYKGKTVGIVGGASAAMEEALYLSGIAEKVIIFCRGSSLKGDRRLYERLCAQPVIEVLFNENVISAGGEERLEYVETFNSADKLKKKHNLDGLFVSIGRIPASEPFINVVATDEEGYILTDDCLMTNIKGVFAVGDIRAKKWRQIATAVSDGAAAAIEAEKYIRRRQNEVQI